MPTIKPRWGRCGLSQATHLRQRSSLCYSGAMLQDLADMLGMFTSNLLADITRGKHTPLVERIRRRWRDYPVDVDARGEVRESDSEKP